MNPFRWIGKAYADIVFWLAEAMDTHPVLYTLGSLGVGYIAGATGAIAFVYSFVK